jgi:P-type Cu+ transporter
MRVDQATTAEHRQTEHGTHHFCSAHCAAEFDADPDRYTAPTSDGMHEGGDPR